MSAILTTIRDITERRLREIAIQEETERLRKENIRLRSSIKERYRFGDIIGKSRPMQEIYELILKAANSDANVVVYGESGAGKEMVARAIHDMSNRRDKDFVAVNCGAIPETLLESEFFGYKKGAFTGANMDKHGYLDLAGEGTLFLDEVSELDLNLQVKLLRVIDGGGYTPVGSNKTKYSDFRIIAATNNNLLEQVNKNLMREDFFYRLHVIPITVPPLRERKEDIPLLVEHFLKLYCDSKEKQSLPGKIFEALHNHNWPGNVRELENVLKRYLTIQRLDFINPRGSKAANEVNDSGKE
ncbi:MAG: sigma-54-dependent Fis family transcriptional regulator [Deltaproteobacteria bacterium]|nr:sigma-54-dependent Fis family transcriptional regulator [Deltaproteobacteria bacterium]